MQEEEETIVRKVRGKPRAYSKSPAASTTSKYFPSPPKKEACSNNHDNGDDDDDLHMVTTATPILPTDATGPSRPKKESSDKEDESDEDDWEEVEGRKVDRSLLIKKVFLLIFLHFRSGESGTGRKDDLAV